MIWIMSIIFLCLALPLVVGIFLSAPKYKGPTSDHFDGKRFKNYSGAKAHGFFQVIKWMLNRKQGPWKALNKVTSTTKPHEQANAPRITFINHSTLLIQTEGINLLTDPVYSRRASPFTWVGPKRMREPGIAFEDLPTIHFVLISHNHYDHLDKETVLKLYKQFDPVFITPLGVDKFFNVLGIKSAEALDWGQKRQLNADVEVIAVPAQHFSGRGMFDRDATLWNGYILKRKKGNIYFAGDSGYDQDIFRQIGKEFAPVKLAMIPIGAYKPRWFMAPVHTSPSDAVKAHQDLNAAQTIATHFGTFPLGDDGETEPIEDLKKTVEAEDIPEGRVQVLNEGDVLQLE